jgi:hypothetical protein
MPDSVEVPETIPQAELVEQWVVKSSRDDSIVVGPIDDHGIASDEADRLSREAAHNLITTAPTATGDALPAATYYVGTVKVPVGSGDDADAG